MELILHLPAALSSWVTALNVFIFIIIRVMRGCLLPLPDSKPLERMNVSPHKSSFSNRAYLSLPTISGFVNCLGINRHLDFPGCASGKKKSTFQCRRHKRPRFNPKVEKIPWRRKWQPYPVFLPGEFHGQRSLMGYSLWGRKESAITEAT